MAESTTTAPEPVPVATVVIADDDEGIRRALAELIDDHVGLTLVGSAADGAVAAELCRHWRPDVAVVDVMMPEGGVAAVSEIRRVAPGTRVVVYTARSDRRTHRQLLAAGAELVLVKGGHADLADELVDVAGRGRRGDDGTIVSPD